MTGGIHIIFWLTVYRKPRLFASEPFMGVCRELAHTVNSLGDLSFERFWFSDAVGCCFCGFLMCNGGWLFCISFILTFDVSGFNVLKEFDGIVFFAKFFAETFYVAVNWVFGCSLTPCFWLSFGIFLHSCSVKTVLCQMWNCVCFLFPSKKVFIDCYRDTDADREHVVAVCNMRIWSSSLCCDSVFETYIWLVVFT